MDSIKHQEGGKIHQVLVKLLDGKHRALNFTNPIITVETLKNKIQTLTSIPPHHQLLVSHDHPTTSILHHDHKTLYLPSGPCQDGNFPPVVHLLLRLRGGKGGFGSLLRGAATKAGQKKTNNFDACRDMSGRRLRHVNAEKKLEEWRAEAEERKLEKMAEEFIKKKAKETAKKGKGKGGEDADKYVDKYRQDSAKCMEDVERSVRESLKGLVASSKRKAGAGAEGNESHSKKFKVWLGKRKMDDGDSEMDEEDSDEDEEENNMSIVIDNGDHSDSSKEADGSSDSVTDTKRDTVSSGRVQSQSDSEEEKQTVTKESEKSGGIAGAQTDSNSLAEPTDGISEEKTFQEGDKLCVKIAVISGPNTQEEVSNMSDSFDVGEIVISPPTVTNSGDGVTCVAEVDDSCTSKPGIQDEVVTTSAEALNLEKPLNLEEFNSAAELEVLGMERLKLELQAQGIKCGGTLQERAMRLFLLKTTPIEKLPKKLLAKK